MVTYRVIQNDVGCFDLTSRNGVSINGKNLANKKIQLNENKRMLVQTFKAKRPRYPSVKDSGKKFFPTTSDNSDDIEMTDMQQQWQQTSFVDQKYRDFHRKRRSEKVLKIINSMMTHSQSDMQKVLSNTSSLKKTRQENPTSLLSTTFPNANTDVTYKQRKFLFSLSDLFSLWYWCFLFALFRTSRAFPPPPPLSPSLVVFQKTPWQEAM